MPRTFVNFANIIFILCKLWLCVFWLHVVISHAMYVDLKSRLTAACAQNGSWFQCVQQDGVSLHCINQTQWRNGVVDCDDGSDEFCPIGTVHCGSTKCVRRVDFQGCAPFTGNTFCEQPGALRCADGLECYLNHTKLDSIVNCADGSDERLDVTESLTLQHGDLATTRNPIETSSKLESLMSSTTRSPSTMTTSCKHSLLKTIASDDFSNPYCNNKSDLNHYATVQLRVLSICDQPVHFNDLLAQTNSLEFESMMLLLKPLIDFVVNRDKKHFRTACLPKVPMEQGSLLFVAKFECTSTNCCSENTLKELLVRSETTDQVKLDSDFVKGVCCSVEFNTCDANAVCISSGLTYNCTCKAGFVDNSVDSQFPGRSCEQFILPPPPSPMPKSTVFHDQIVISTGMTTEIATTHRTTLSGTIKCNGLRIGRSCFALSTVVALSALIVGVVLLFICCCYCKYRDRNTESALLASQPSGSNSESPIQHVQAGGMAPIWTTSHAGTNTFYNQTSEIIDELSLDRPNTTPTIYESYMAQNKMYSALGHGQTWTPPNGLPDVYEVEDDVFLDNDNPARRSILDEYSLAPTRPQTAAATSSRMSTSVTPHRKIDPSSSFASINNQWTNIATRSDSRSSFASNF